MGKSNRNGPEQPGDCKQYPKNLQTLNKPFHSNLEKYDRGTFLWYRIWLLKLISFLALLQCRGGAMQEFPFR